MQFSETVLAAMIGAIATLLTALFQLFTVLRSRSKLEIRPKKGMTSRSIAAVVALMIASGVGGYLYSELRQQHAGEDLRSMRDELNAKLQLLATTTERLALSRDTQAQTTTMAPTMAVAVVPATDSAESVIYAPGCPASANCTEAGAQKWVLCGAIPSTAQVRKLELFAKPERMQSAWDRAAANFEQDIGGAKFTGSPVEHPQDENRKVVCVDFVHWSSEPHVARIVIQYGAVAENPSLPRESTTRESTTRETTLRETAPSETTAAATAVATPVTQGMSLAPPLIAQ